MIKIMSVNLKVMKYLKVLIFVCFFIGPFLLKGNEIYQNTSGVLIVNKGVSSADIVVPVNSNKQIMKAAQTLQKYLLKSTGANLKITTQTGSRNFISIGNTNFIKRSRINLNGLDEDGFLIQTINKKYVVIAGGSDWGTEFGVYEFLERFLDITWLMPTALGEYVPQKNSLIIPDTKILDNPVFLSRQISPANINLNKPLDIWARLNRFRGRIEFHHNLNKLFPPNQYLRKNPDFYGMENGKRATPKTGQYKWQPNFTAKGIADSAANNIVRYFKQNPDKPSYSLGTNDYKVFDQSSLSKSKRSNRNNFLGLEDVSDDYFDWANQVAAKVNKVYPNKKFGTLAYNNLAEPPRNSINPNIIPFITYERLKWKDPSMKKLGIDVMNEWKQKSSSLGWYDYAYGFNYLVPRVWFHHMQDYLQLGEKNNIKYYYAELYPNWGEGPKPWIMSKLLWNPNQDVDALLNEWYNKAAGKDAAPKLRRFYEIWEKFWTVDVFNTKWYVEKGQFMPFRDLSYLSEIPDSYVNESDNLMKSAYQLAKTSDEKGRVSELLKMWNLYKSAINIYKSENKVNLNNFSQVLNPLKSDAIHAETIKAIENKIK